MLHLVIASFLPSYSLLGLFLVVKVFVDFLFSIQLSFVSNLLHDSRIHTILQVMSLTSFLI